MILLTVGMQLPFDRLVRTVDEIAPTLACRVQGQIHCGSYVPRHLRWRAMIAPAEFDRMVAEASLVVAHAGMGSVLSAQRHRKPIVLLPRRATLHEHRNEHQLATARALEGYPGIYIAWHAAELAALLERAPELVGAAASGVGRYRLCERLVTFMEDGARPG